MIDFRKILEEGSCEKNHGCNVATTCMCALAEDAIDEIDRLRAALQKIASGPVTPGKEHDSALALARDIIHCSQDAARAALHHGVKQPSGESE